MTEHAAGTPAGPDEPVEARGRSSARTALIYTALRIAVFALVFVVLWLFGVDVYPALLIAVLVSGALSFVLLRRQRDALTATVAQRVERGRRQRASRERAPTPEEVARVTGRALPNQPGSLDQPGAPNPPAP